MCITNPNLDPSRPRTFFLIFFWAVQQTRCKTRFLVVRLRNRRRRRVWAQSSETPVVLLAGFSLFVCVANHQCISFFMHFFFIQDHAESYRTTGFRKSAGDCATPKNHYDIRTPPRSPPCTALLSVFSRKMPIPAVTTLKLRVHVQVCNLHN